MEAQPNIPKPPNSSNKSKNNFKLPTQQNPTNNSLSVGTANTVTKPWWKFWAGKHSKTHRKTKHHKRIGSRGGNRYIGMDEASIQRNINEMRQTYGSKSENEKIILAGKIQNARNALNAILEQNHNALKKAGYGTIGGRKTHHKKRHMRRGSRKTLRK